MAGMIDSHGTRITVGANLMNDTDPYSFCERQPNNFIPAPVGDSETNESEVA